MSKAACRLKGNSTEEELRADGFLSIGVADIAEEHRQMQGVREPLSVAERHMRELLRRHLAGLEDLDGSSDAVGK